MMKNAFYFMLKISCFRSRDIYIFVLTFRLYKKRLDKKAIVNFKIYNITGWTENNCNAPIAQYLKK